MISPRKPVHQQGEDEEVEKQDTDDDDDVDDDDIEGSFFPNCV